MKKLGLYVHIPFCVQKCLYCDFCSFPKYSEDTVNLYIDALCRDLTEYGKKCGDFEVDTVYFGGGTPTLLSLVQFERIIQCIRRNYRISNGAEISSECNPATADFEYFKELCGIGINRLSIGLQSVNGDELKALGRIHDFSGFKGTYFDARNAGFENISVDLMYGIPLQTLSSFEKTLKTVTELNPEHISAYCLKVEESTPFGKMGEKLVIPDDDTDFEMYMLCSEYLKSFGYEKYEISNFSKAGYESRHNLKYWLMDDYLGFGVSAHSYFCGERFSNSRDINGYISGKDIKGSKIKISAREKMAEYVMVRMRMVKGVEFDSFKREFGVDFFDVYGKALEKFRAGNFLKFTDGGVSFTDSGFFVSNAILSDILDFD